MCVPACLTELGRPDAKDQADGDCEDRGNRGCLSCVRSFIRAGLWFRAGQRQLCLKLNDVLSMSWVTDRRAFQTQMMVESNSFSAIFFGLTHDGKLGCLFVFRLSICSLAGE